MTKTSETKSRTPKMLALIASVGALPLLFSATGCGTGGPVDYGSAHPNMLATTVDVLNYAPDTRPYLGTAAAGEQILWWDQTLNE